MRMLPAFNLPRSCCVRDSQTGKVLTKISKAWFTSRSTAHCGVPRLMYAPHLATDPTSLTALVL